MDNKRNNIKKTIDPLTKIAELKFVTFCFMPKNNKGFLYKKITPGNANVKIRKSNQKNFLIAIFLYVSAIKYIKKKM